MKKLMCSMLMVLLLAFAALGNTVIVKGTIKYSTGGVAAGKTVWIATTPDANSLYCFRLDSVITNPNGYFIDTLSCDAPIKKVTVSTFTCNGELLLKTVDVPASGVVLVEFVLHCPPMQCKPMFFSQQPDSTKPIVYFNSKESFAGLGDSIVRRVWTFGDGSANEGNAVEVKKEYRQPGTYQVCLKIATKNGCINTLCQYITVLPKPPVVCKAIFDWEKIPTTTATGFAFRFHSYHSLVASMDSIVGRIWIFGDGDTLRGNEVNPVHAYRNAGKYEVCLIIKTKKGCESRQCQLLIVEPPSTCKPIVTLKYLPSQNHGYPVKFQSMESYPPAIPGDVVKERRWNFGDGMGVQDDSPNPRYVYKHPGQYLACLWVKTKSGCYDSTCVWVNIPPSPNACQAYFIADAKELKVKFDSKPSLTLQGDSIVKRLWKFGDGKAMDGNVVEPIHQYGKAGKYEVCLTIVTKYGCESKICKVVIVPPGNHSAPCQSNFVVAKRERNRVWFDSKESMAFAQGDSIVQRHWDFGNGQKLYGNVVAPVTEYPPFGGLYSVCLTIKTAKGCENKYCITIKANSTQAPYDSSKVWLVKYYPNPVKNLLYAVIYSPRENEPVEISVLDVYGIVKSTMKVMATKGYSIHNIQTSALLPGPYILRVLSKDGVQSRNFYKVP